MWDMAVCLHNAEPCGFSILFFVAVVMLVTACDVSVTGRRNSEIMRHMSYKLSSFAKTSVPIHSKTSVSRLKEVTLSFSRVSFDVLTFRQEVTRLSCDDKADSKMRLVFSVNDVVASGLTRLRKGDAAL